MWVIGALNPGSAGAGAVSPWPHAAVPKPLVPSDVLGSRAAANKEEPAELDWSGEEQDREHRKALEASQAQGSPAEASEDEPVASPTREQSGSGLPSGKGSSSGRHSADLAGAGRGGSGPSCVTQPAANVTWGPGLAAAAWPVLAARVRHLRGLGARCTEELMVTGPILAHWDVITDTLGPKTSLTRASLSGGRVIVGVVLRAGAADVLREAFGKRAAAAAQEARQAQKLARKAPSKRQLPADWAVSDSEDGSASLEIEDLDGQLMDDRGV
ncbi:unnamed protein product, partial [Prorocentrum cordatum]